MKLFRNAKQWFFSQYGPLGLNRSEPARVLVPRKTSLRHLSFVRTKTGQIHLSRTKLTSLNCPRANLPASS